MSKQNLKIVLDTNVFLVSLASQHSYSWIYDALLDEKYTLCISNEIITEYDEIISSRYGLDSTSSILEGLTLLPNIEFISPSYNWNLLDDEDDNKFVDCAVAAGADFIVSNDKGFLKLRDIPFPPITILRYLEFEEAYKEKIVKRS